jgi:hypothetical protein
MFMCYVIYVSLTVTAHKLNQNEYWFLLISNTIWNWSMFDSWISKIVFYWKWSKFCCCYKYSWGIQLCTNWKYGNQEIRRNTVGPFYIMCCTAISKSLSICFTGRNQTSSLAIIIFLRSQWSVSYYSYRAISWPETDHTVQSNAWLASYNNAVETNVYFSVSWWSLQVHMNAQRLRRLAT